MSVQTDCAGEHVWQGGPSVPGVTGVRALDRGMPGGVNRTIVLHLGCSAWGIERTTGVNGTLDVAARSHGNIDRTLWKDCEL